MCVCRKDPCGSPPLTCLPREGGFGAAVPRAPRGAAGRGSPVTCASHVLPQAGPAHLTEQAGCRQPRASARFHLVSFSFSFFLESLRSRGESAHLTGGTETGCVYRIFAQNTIIFGIHATF